MSDQPNPPEAGAPAAPPGAHWRPPLANCLVWAVVTFWRLRCMRLPPGDELYVFGLWARTTRADGGLFHMGVAERDKDLNMLRILSYTPVVPRQQPFWRPPVVFRGMVKTGDAPGQPPAPMHFWERAVELLIIAILLVAACFGVAHFFVALPGPLQDPAAWLGRLTAMPFSQR